ncbi:BlaI/MecI/CopY family transcriptional regulator [Streptomyces nodosus]|uniref:CopY family transcriptional regulator n=1 Tax=Streptomyces nodosus TaxID=40318 RepID=A0A0B5DFW7_9ACTN|nr:BlaI/MecI/CopY family transcriptional regulator [Streptomyces nodosus]AJE38907.1 CopY family transcriptional regulator [Streptomyces nodosus]MBB4789719.1 putative transcriptional regulator [Streptomyces nodosus]QEV37491.1 BlaI/MecI/CopY family transcriptional regulator [Streptomyces nodosus]
MPSERRDERRQHGELVADVLAVLWESDEPMTAQQVNAALDRGLARTTVATILSRLYEKGTLRRVPVLRGFAYEPMEDAAGLVASRMRRELESDPRRDLVLKRFVSSLSESDEETLRSLLREAEDGPE